MEGPRPSHRRIALPRLWGHLRINSWHRLLMSGPDRTGEIPVHIPAVPVSDVYLTSSTSLCFQLALAIEPLGKLRWASSKLTVSIARTRIAAVADTNT